ncbi:MAG: ATP-dependent DNA helicase [Gammaproteobacteria bacterium]|nr:ATP-dependent DNA helicase [Gammaproteobacteria bacterium]
MRPADLLGSEGPFSKSLDGYMPREGQQALSNAIADVIENNNVLVAEAGTGIGKTYAYLIPVLLADKKTLISTGTRHLQDQLFHSDLPVVMKTLGIASKVSLLKGRSNYLCLHRLSISTDQMFLTSETKDHIQKLRSWGKSTISGDISEMSEITEDDRVWPLVTSTVENCLGSECPDWDDCFVVKARREAQESDIVVINHHLLLADMSIKEEGFGELLPSSEVFIIDEAHQLPDVASRFFGKTISSRQLNNLVNDSIAEHLKDAPDMYEIRDVADDLHVAVKDFRLALGNNNQRDAWFNIVNKPALKQMRESLQLNLKDLADVLEEAAERSKGLEQCYQRCLLILNNLTAYGKEEDSAETEQQGYIYWYETFTKGFILHMTPLDIAALFKSHQQAQAASWVFTSATLQVGSDFNHFANNLGLENYQQGNWVSPFDYQQQSLLYLPESLPEPSSYDFTSQLIDKAVPVLQSSGGRAFLLFTSYRALNEAATLLKSKIDFPILVQGSLPKHQLLEKFKQLGNAVLLGTSSFWEGVDVRGEALSCVIIDKLPFASPGDPVMQARLDAIKRTGGQPFMDYQLPQAVIALKQGAGRLIRDVADYGVLMLGDPRLSNKGYGRLFIKSLPDMPITRDIADVKNFFSIRDKSKKSASLAETIEID